MGHYPSTLSIPGLILYLPYGRSFIYRHNWWANLWTFLYLYIAQCEKCSASHNAEPQCSISLFLSKDCSHLMQCDPPNVTAVQCFIVFIIYNVDRFIMFVYGIPIAWQLDDVVTIFLVMLKIITSREQLMTLATCQLVWKLYINYRTSPLSSPGPTLHPAQFQATFSII